MTRAMVDLKGYYNKNVLDALLSDGTIGRMEYIFHHSEAMKYKYMEYCRKAGLPLDDDSAEEFFRRQRKEKVSIDR